MLDNKFPSFNNVNICTTTTLKTSIKNTLFFVNYHLSKGICKMYLFFDDPMDLAIDELKNYEKVVCTRCDENHWKNFSNQANPTFFEKQRINASYALEMAKKEKYQWISHIDSDELIFSNAPLKKLLAFVHKETQIIYLPVLESLPQHHYHTNPFEEIQLFKESISPGSVKNSVDFKTTIGLIFNRTLYRLRINLFRLLGGSFKHGFIIGHEQGKCIVRICDNISGYDVHYPISETPLKFEYFNNLKLLHYEAPDFVKWKHKWSIRINGVQNYILGSEKEKYIANHFKNVYTNDEKSLEFFNNLYLISGKWYKILNKLRLIKRIQINSWKR